ncbi:MULTISPECIES: hypothetical protein [unclassified Leptolyngbya]|uniref:hypothetical protein n=1 Tax=unclassified Leptolyngbya TaxID=2650499 RepID=UPI001682F2D1|nr:MULTISPECIES: hypothetical protein [unclassified Leptolyngbya]MBD1910986.1 hypothetical protein [Leptolyngbya sp. FACHB-8]MBD2158347.1 hypothetical protein [Leptolyngbya sp. FACHB-16]
MDSRHPLSPRSPLLVSRRSPAPSWMRVKTLLSPPRGDRAILLEALLWVAGAAVLRMVADFVLTAMPILWVPVALILALPSVLAISLATWAPPLSLVLGYRLTLTAMGLLLGGKL